MKVAVSSTGPSLDAYVDPRFGRCAYFAMVDPETLDAQFVPNPGITLGQGAGIQAAQTVTSHGVDAVITGQLGPNAYQALSAAGIAQYLVSGGTVREAVQRFRMESLAGITGATVPAHAGLSASMPGENESVPGTPASIGQGIGFGLGFGMGRGMGRGMGCGNGRGMGRGLGPGNGRGMGRGFGRGNGRNMGRGAR